MAPMPWKREKGEESPALSKSMDQNLQLELRHMETAFETFRRTYPAYDATRKLDELRSTEYGRLDRDKQVYLDYTGAGLYADSQLKQHMELLSKEVLGNPHSKNLSSIRAIQYAERARTKVLQYFNADPDEYMVVFTNNASSALKLVGESYPFGIGGIYLLTSDNHNSVNGIREFAQAKGASVRYTGLCSPELCADEAELREALAAVCPGGHKLFAYPAQSNFSGVRHPLEWIGEAQDQGWDVLLDAASLAASSPLDLSRWHPDFVPISFYKIFGYPTGIGCLLVRRKAAAKLRRPWYGGGTIVFSSVSAFDHYLNPGPAGFEDGTADFLSYPAVEFGLDWIGSIGIDTIQTRVACLTGWLIDQLLLLYHRNGKPLVRLYGPQNMDRRGGTVQMNFFNSSGAMIDCYTMEKLANQERISLRAGDHCNPGAREAAMGIRREDLVPCFSDKEHKTYEQFLNGLEGKMTGTLRASLGLASNFADVYRFIQFAKTFIDYRA